MAECHHYRKTVFAVERFWARSWSRIGSLGWRVAFDGPEEVHPFHVKISHMKDSSQIHLYLHFVPCLDNEDLRRDLRFGSLVSRIRHGHRSDVVWQYHREREGLSDYEIEVASQHC